MDTITTLREPRFSPKAQSLEGTEQPLLLELTTDIGNAPRFPLWSEGHSPLSVER